MMISTKGRYALRIMVDLAQHDGEEPVSVRAIAQRQDISGKYMEQIISVLTRAGLLRSVRGAQGGYTLAKPPEEITVRQVVVALEGDMAIVDCQRGAQCKDADKCATHKVWNRISDAVNGALDAITLKDMLNDYSCAQARGD